ncbi:ATP phosphoribosyltransferase [Ponticaulis sp.]|uniref:ATP phosphoribosyltransferase n=1 Tax=Ponticaulis sp. TaxID=2020902 RepID=UPI000B6254D8|nr:ATP phosphoribosyltransferase [Ponticaulis sp.]MAJ09949.1 ATP phosphoribosyltransferase [Ponticaulis sp.]RPG18558.1 MAG: ATP phosphoribosyltransferase [Hyphomonadaceae bacterium TMED125]HBH88704.1 ATP phosphoribosyltransferase [Hyphomonadaceae bacterium]HBJ93289.1 ATP phosphoribosyltransferase [Hyphomonadaceae bacterium]|tara:strand:- start:6851 stop:7798 length:948 start_codon:yes stop_codon:yes gene_type:complete
MTQLMLAIPSKGRLKEQTEAFFADCGLKLKQVGGERGYSAVLEGAPGIQIMLLSASEIAKGLLDGTLHLGVTGEDLLREHADKFDSQVHLLRALGFGYADMVVAVPQSWVDVDTIEDLEDVGHAFRARHGRRMRVATKYLRSSRRFFAERGLTQYRLIDSAGATEAAPASGTAELIVDITTTGATLKANNLKILSDGVMLKSQAQLSASLNADWNEDALAAIKNLLDIFEARRVARDVSVLTGGTSLRSAAASISDEVTLLGDSVVLPREKAKSVANALSSAGFGPVSVVNPEFLFLEDNLVYGEFSRAITRNAQ